MHATYFTPEMYVLEGIITRICPQASPLNGHIIIMHSPPLPPPTHTHTRDSLAMFSLFICVTQDGWMSITNELNSCGNSILGAIYLVIFITIGAFVFANLVVAVVVTNLV